jgi:hypothetical protein
MGFQCNQYQPRCPFASTPSNGKGKFEPLGGSVTRGLFCAPYNSITGIGVANTRPAKGGTATDMGNPVPPLYRNPAFFTPLFDKPDHFGCTGRSKNGVGGPGIVQAGQPVTGVWTANTTGTQLGGFNFFSAPATGSDGIRVTGVVGEVQATYPYAYSYTYATFRNDVGSFGIGQGPGNFNLTFQVGASINVKQGPAKFGGTMRMLGALTTKVCFYREKGCSLGGADWRYDAVGASASTSTGGAITAGYQATYQAYYYHTALMKQSTINVEGSRFPWTTGTVTVTATGRGPHKTIHYTHGYDNRNTGTPSGIGTIQLVTPVLTRWLQPAFNFETGGVGILRIKFLPEPQAWVTLVAGISLLAVAKRMRGR